VTKAVLAFPFTRNYSCWHFHLQETTVAKQHARHSPAKKKKRKRKQQDRHAKQTRVFFFLFSIKQNSNKIGTQTGQTQTDTDFCELCGLASPTQKF